MYVAAIIAAGGRGARLGAAIPKQLVLLDGLPILQRSVDAVLACPDVHELIVALPPDQASHPPAYLRDDVRPVRVVAGGPRRQDSVANAFDAVSDRADVVVIHDAARPLVSPGLVARTIAAAHAAGAAVAAIQAHDTVKQASGGADRMIVNATLARERIYLAQTPQAFRREVLRDAVARGRAGASATDEASLAEQAGHVVQIVEGESRNIKVTTPDDLVVAEALLGSGRSTGLARVGTGYDLHRLAEGRPLILGGVTVPFPLGLLGHSDADVVCHAVTDAVLGAAGAGDIGLLFPDTDATWKGASSLDLLRRAAAVVRDRGFIVDNVDVVVVAERPKLAPHLGDMRRNVAEALGIAPDCVSVKGKTQEGVGEIGRGEAMAAHAVALVRRIGNPAGASAGE